MQFACCPCQCCSCLVILQALHVEVKLYPDNVKRPQDIKPCKQAAKQQARKKQPAAKPANSGKQLNHSDATPNHTTHGQLPEDVQQRHEQQQQQQQLMTSPSLRHLLQTQQQHQQQEGPDPARHTIHEQWHGPQQQRQQHAPAVNGKAAGCAVALGSVIISVWWAPTRRSHGCDMAERVSFCLLPGEIKVCHRCRGPRCCQGSKQHCSIVASMV